MTKETDEIITLKKIHKHRELTGVPRDPDKFHAVAQHLLEINKKQAAALMFIWAKLEQEVSLRNLREFSIDAPFLADVIDEVPDGATIDTAFKSFNLDQYNKIIQSLDNSREVMEKIVKRDAAAWNLIKEFRYVPPGSD